MENLTITASLDMSALDLIINEAKALFRELPLQLRDLAYQRFVELLDGDPIDLADCSAGACEMVILAKPSVGLMSFLAAIRARNANLAGLELFLGYHDAPSLIEGETMRRES